MIRQVTPMLHVPSLEAAVDFYVGVLGFSMPFQIANYAYLTRDRAAVRILADSEQPVASADEGRTTVYFDVDDVDALYTELEPRLAQLPAGDVVGPADQPWDQRELLIRMPNGDWLAFGQPVRR